MTTKVNYAILNFIGTMVLCAQPATVRGKLIDPEGGPVGAARVQMKNTSTGEILAATSSAGGSYTLSLPVGVYDLAVLPIGCCRWSRVSEAAVSVSAGESRTWDIHVPWGLGLGTIGDDISQFYTELRERSKPPAGEAPRGTEGQPDLSGLWLNVPDASAAPAPLQPWASELARKRSADSAKDFPGGFCLPQSPLTIATGLFKLVQTPSLMVQLSEAIISSRQIFLDGRAHPADPNLTWQGHSIGHWEGDTLIVDTVGFNDHSWLSVTGSPHTEQMHTIERIRRPDLGHLEIELTVEDPGAFTKPWVRTINAVLAPQEIEIMEYVCENNRDPVHIVGR